MNDLSPQLKQHFREIYYLQRPARTAVFEDIPYQKLETVRSRFQLFKGENIILFFDETVLGDAKKGILMTDKHLYYRGPLGTDVMNYKDIQKMTFGFFYTFVHMKDGRVITMETMMGRGKLFRTIREIATVLQTENLEIEIQNSIKSVGRCLGCGAQLATTDEYCPYCGRQLETYVAPKQRLVVSTFLKKMAISLFLIFWFGLAIWFLIIPILDLGFDGLLREIINDLSPRTTFDIDEDFSTNVISLRQMEIMIDPTLDPTLTNRMNHYNGFHFYVFDGFIYKGDGKRVIRYDSNFGDYQVVSLLDEAYSDQGRGLQTFWVNSDYNVLYYVLTDGDLHHTLMTGNEVSESVRLARDIHNPYFHIRDDDEIRRPHIFYQNVTATASHDEVGDPERTGFPIYILNSSAIGIQDNPVSSWLPRWDEVDEFYIQAQQNRAFIVHRHSINRFTFSAGVSGFLDLHTITNDFRFNADESGVLALNHEHLYWTDRRSRITRFNHEDEAIEMIGRFEDVVHLNLIHNYLLAVTGEGNLYLLDTQNRTGRRLARNVTGVAVVGNHLIFDNTRTQTLHVMDLDGNMALLESAPFNP